MNRRYPALFVALILVLLVTAGCRATPKLTNVKDGTWFGVSTPDARGSYGIAAVTVAGSMIKGASYVEIDGGSGLPKATPTYTYAAALGAIASLPQTLIQKGDVAKVDAVAGATGTSGLFKSAVSAALANGGATAQSNASFQAVVQQLLQKAK